MQMCGCWICPWKVRPVHRMFIRASWVLSLCFVQSWLCSIVMSAEYCDDVQDWCARRIGCGMALQHFFVGCKENLFHETDVCTTSCKRALISLLSSEDDAGLDFINCNCSGDPYCLERKQGIEVCTNDVLSAIHSVNDGDSVVSCTLAKWICEADSSCLTALEFYTNHCGKLFIGDRCTERCNNSVTILYQQAKAQKLQNCECDGSEVYDCKSIRYYTDVLCFNKVYQVKNINGGDRSSVSQLCVGLMIASWLWWWRHVLGGSLSRRWHIHLGH